MKILLATDSHLMLPLIGKWLINKLGKNCRNNGKSLQMQTTQMTVSRHGKSWPTLPFNFRPAEKKIDDKNRQKMCNKWLDIHFKRASPRNYLSANFSFCISCCMILELSSIYIIYLSLIKINLGKKKLFSYFHDFIKNICMWK